MSTLLRLARLYLTALGAVAPGLAGRQAARLFLTPLPRAAPSRWDAPASVVPLSFQGERLDAWAWGDGPCVLLAHGWGGRGSHLSRLVAPLVERGLRVVAFDGPAHGRSRARRTDLVEFATLLVRLERQLGGVHAMIGHSFGASAVAYALRLGATPNAVALVSPFAESDTNVERFARTLGLSPRLHARTRAALLGYFDAHADGWDLRTVAPDLRTPALIVHDRDDAEIPYREGANLAAAWPGAHLRSTERLGHRLILKDPDVIRDVVAFVAGARIPDDRTGEPSTCQ
ncbi:alpha/beta hydrolase [Virgisporangium aliadipatigenens]|uniref:Alpha/beta hydrolase n=1 Tax=Virgisporangium aliadipatigenens TaxID=741659 RepID=A0A8J4DNM9_9ACTN|nr:alpha/beta fold hydrolase [Virgisporangium aliadipatigenens]GIJ43677.1 alpha/beta hydrolase [Virgisporangium aliadipatigenens]